jgi:hypothetical protein
MKKINGLRPVSESGINPKDEYGAHKVALGVVPATANIFLAMAMGHGAEKYGPYNFRVSKVQGFIYLEACKRHLEALIDGQDFDPSTGIPHGAFVMATMAVYVDAWINGFLIDNRPLPGKGGDLIEALNRVPGEPKHTPEQMQAIIEGIIASNKQEKVSGERSHLGSGDSLPLKAAAHRDTDGTVADRPGKGLEPNDDRSQGQRHSPIPWIRS